MLFDQVSPKIQANILKGHNRNYVMFMFCQWKDSHVEKAAEWLRIIGQEVSSHQYQEVSTKIYKKYRIQVPIITLGLTQPASEVLGLFEKGNDFGTCEILQDKDFETGMHSSPGEFVPKYIKNKDLSKADKELRDIVDRIDRHHVLLMIAHDNKCQLTEEKQRLLSLPGFLESLELDEGEESPFSIIIKQKRIGEKRKNGKAKVAGPWGFKDNISQPNLANGDNIFKVAFGEEVLHKQDTKKLWTFMAFQKHLLHTAEFDQRTKSIARQMQNKKDWPAHLTTQEYVKALLIGRFQDGTPLAFCDSSEGDASSKLQNNFDYDDDKIGAKCPLNAHIRSANPRVNKDRVSPIIRRSIVTDEPCMKDKQQEALYFFSYQVSIENNLQPIYLRMLGKESTVDKIKYPGSKVDAILYPPDKKEKEDHTIRNLIFYPRSEDQDKRQTFRRFGDELTTFVTGQFYLIPPISFLRN